MSDPVLTLASGSAVRARLLERAGVPHRILLPRVDEETARAALLAEGASPRDLADGLAELKCARIAARVRGLVLGCDQILAMGDFLPGKPSSPEEARAQLATLQGNSHRLLSAAVLYEDGQPVWRHVAEARLTMRPLTGAQIDRYVIRNWESIRHAVGCYKLEEEGIRLFTTIEGSYFTILGLPLLELVDYLLQRGSLDL